MKFEFYDQDGNPCPPDQRPTYLGFECPKRPGELCYGRLLLRGNPSHRRHINRDWWWNNSRVAPTVAPSVDCKGCSHGFIEDGKWRDA